ncbi:MAG: MBL fold metallo-hydrolase [Candidatus Marinimicrobia bacterium]|nr:MBL fold metallo-hydrolase [Candidatus Neomarinimicrobiota bacterium]
MYIDTLTLGMFQSNAYLLTEGNETLIIDPGEPYKKIDGFIEKNHLNPVGIICTHGHLDHIISAPELMKKYQIPCFLHEKEKEVLAYLRPMCAHFHVPYYGEPDPVTWLKDHGSLTVGHFQLDYRHTPGHTLGGICILTKEGVFTGDTLFYESVGRTDFPGGDANMLMISIKTQILSLPDETVLYPGHGPTTTVKHEKEHNPFLKGS